MVAKVLDFVLNRKLDTWKSPLEDFYEINERIAEYLNLQRKYYDLKKKCDALIEASKED